MTASRYDANMSIRSALARVARWMRGKPEMTDAEYEEWIENRSW